MPVVNGTYVGQQPGRLGAQELGQAVLGGKAAANQDAVNLANSFENEWQRFEASLLPTMTSEAGAQAAYQRYRAGLELRNRATGSTLTPQQIDELALQWYKMQMSKLAYVGQNGQRQAAPPPPAAPAGDQAAGSADSGTPPPAGETPPAVAADSKEFAFVPAYEGPTDKTLFMSTDGQWYFTDTNGVRQGPYATSAQASVAKRDMVAAGAPTGTDYKVQQTVQGWAILDATGRVVQSFGQGEAEHAKALAAAKKLPKQTATLVTAPMATGGVAPAAPQPYDVQMGDRRDPVTGQPKAELVLDLQDAVRDPAGAVARALAVGVPPGVAQASGASPAAAPRPEGGAAGAASAGEGGQASLAGFSQLQGVSPIPPGLGQADAAMRETSAMQGAARGQAPAPKLREPVSNSVKNFLNTANVKLSSAVASLKANADTFTKQLALPTASQQVNNMTANARSNAGQMSPAFKIVKSAVSKDLKTVAGLVGQVASLPEYKVFLKETYNGVRESLRNASAEDLAALGMTDVANVKMTRAQLDNAREIAAAQLASQEYLAELQIQASAGNAMAQSMTTSLEAIKSLMSAYQPIIDAETKKGRSWAQIKADNPEIANLSNIMSAILGKGGESYTKTFFGGVATKPLSDAEQLGVNKTAAGLSGQLKSAKGSSSSMSTVGAGAAAKAASAPSTADAFLKSTGNE